jgi:hypothetical protein
MGGVHIYLDGKVVNPNFNLALTLLNSVLFTTYVLNGYGWK